MYENYVSPGTVIVQGFPGYNSWSMIEAVGTRLICAYSRGAGHSIDEACRAVYARVSDDNGETWQEEVLVLDNADHGDVASGSGVDSSGAMLLWTRSCRSGIFPFEGHFSLFRTVDGKKFELLSIPELAVQPMQITGIFSVPGVGLMSLWFAGNYRGGDANSWGTLTSSDNGRSWVQHVVGSNLSKIEWPTEPSAVYLGEGKILAIARREKSPDSSELPVQFQLESRDYGKTWSVALTAINDIRESTPALIFDPETGIVSNYYYQRIAGALKRRTAQASKVFGDPSAWSAPEIITFASKDDYHAGNVNAAVLGNTHFLSIYTGNETDTAVVVHPTSAPGK
ncbi:MAG: exo-alpha-sialidase [Lentisphaeria bacterium]|nr:exo-alpha-sialidase [Lentisphaeria bacterium]